MNKKSSSLQRKRIRRINQNMVLVRGSDYPKKEKELLLSIYEKQKEELRLRIK